ncbi:(2Fe-2S)-binding protein [Rhodobacteraceae bacterium RKSG542]|uniref:(2Fe-2S)-binding protein n=1 Tax=Pseudovibrio flavus TaxID=2529854 RepID=UPI0012BCAABA|nr:(2Fe-2S)-binding protein [Pseudovibrio flavus]MTI17736.1 (2Fe-2S)-binding protein [Pseudovibrio flavus]
MNKISLTVNGNKVEASVETRVLLSQLLREELGLTGTHVGCDTSQCGACTVHLDGEAVKSCSVLAAACDGAKVETIESLSDHPLQEAMVRHQGLQCGFCTPGVVMSGLDMIRRHGSSLTRERIAEELEGNICRCTGYRGMVDAIYEVSQDV